MLLSSCTLGVIVSFLVLLRAADAATLGLGTALGVMPVEALGALDCF